MKNQKHLLGAHMSTAGGVFRAVERAAEAGCDVVQLFSKNNNQWSGPPTTPEVGKRFKDALAEHKIGHPLIHDSYLINLASPDDALWEKSVAAFRDELQRAAVLGVPWVVTHPGSFTTSSEQEGLDRVAAALDRLSAEAVDLGAGCLLEATAGQGTNLGWKFEHLAAILAGVKDSSWLGVCIDSCHIFAGGYPLASEAEYAATWAQFDRIVGFDRLKAFHLNDSVKGLGCRVDRHAHIAEGSMGEEPFRRLLQDPRFVSIPMYLETPKGDRDGVDLDVINLATLRRLAGE